MGLKDNLFIAESFMGNHACDPFWEADLLSFTFLPNIILKRQSEHGASWEIPNSFRGLWLNGIIIGNTKKELVELLEKYTRFIIGTDYDIEGNAMAYMIKQLLLTLGFKSEAVVRVPLTHEGYVGILPFWSKEEFDWYIKDKFEDETWKQISKRTNGTGIGRRSMLIEDIMNGPPETVKNLNESGTSTITYIFKKSIKEK